MQFLSLQKNMANEVWWIGLDDINIWWWIREDTNKVTEEAVRRIQQQQQQAKQIQWEIKKDKAINDKLAKFLGFLLKAIKNDQLISQIYTVFFKTKHPKTEMVYLRKSINTIIIVGLFFPFYKTEAEKEGIQWFFEELYGHGDIHLTKYITYIKNLFIKYHDNIPIDKEEFIELIKIIAEQYGMIGDLNQEKIGEFKKTLKKELYNQ